MEFCPTCLGIFFLLVWNFKLSFLLYVLVNCYCSLMAIYLHKPHSFMLMVKWSHLYHMNTKYFFPGNVARLPSTLPSSAFIYHKTYSCCCGNGVLDIILPESCKIKFTRGFISELHLVISESCTLRSLNTTAVLYLLHLHTYHGSSICV